MRNIRSTRFPDLVLFFKRPLWKIVVVSCCFWGALGGGLWLHHRRQEALQHDARFIIKRIAARPETQDRLPLALLVELLGLDNTLPPSLFAIRPQQLRSRLLSYPSVADAKIVRLLPGTIGVEYALRVPLATIAGVKNVGVDARGHVFFLFPFYAPKKLPSLILPLSDVSSLKDVQKQLWRMRETAIGLKLLELASELARLHHMNIEVIDVSKLRHQNVFRREVVVGFSSFLSQEEPLYVRMRSRNILPMLEQLPRILDRVLRGGIRGGMIDLRFGSMVLLSGGVAQGVCPVREVASGEAMAEGA